MPDDPPRARDDSPHAHNADVQRSAAYGSLAWLCLGVAWVMISVLRPPHQVSLFAAAVAVGALLLAALVTSVAGIAVAARARLDPTRLGALSVSALAFLGWLVTAAQAIGS